MWLWRRRTPGTFDHLRADQGPPEGSEIRPASTPLLPSLGGVLTRDGVEADVVWLHIHRTFETSAPSTPWAMTILMLRELDSKGVTLLPTAFVQHAGALPGLEQAAAGLPPLRLDLRLESHTHVPEDDDACYGSSLELTWFCDDPHAWLAPLKEAVRKSLDWKVKCRPLFRDVQK